MNINYISETDTAWVVRIPNPNNPDKKENEIIRETISFLDDKDEALKRACIVREELCKKHYGFGFDELLSMNGGARLKRYHRDGSVDTGWAGVNFYKEPKKGYLAYRAHWTKLMFVDGKIKKQQIKKLFTIKGRDEDAFDAAFVLAASTADLKRGFAPKAPYEYIEKRKYIEGYEIKK
ncbi:hypothetical protein [Aliivibrio fischeri]|uniref:hypothetical protein n=1 Tax=Aliivibrio fischeri TaxID=668 RepID=UPI0007C49FB2|nr:hypothetical protein [Aliivibrio fischeri]